MPRKPRIHFSGAIYHAMARGVEGRAIFIDDLDRADFLADLVRIAAQASAEILAYCLMGNHFHLAIKVGRVSLSTIMQRLMGRHAERFNWRWERKGHLFQGRYKANLCVDDRYLRSLIRYIHMNPVRAGLVAAPEDWPWSSARVVATPPQEDVDFDPWAKGPVLLRNIERNQRDMAEIAATIAATTGVSVGGLRCRSREARLVGARRGFSLTAIEEGYSMTAIAAWLETTVSSVSRYSRG